MDLDLDLRSWLMILGSIFVISVLAHGYLRKRRNRNRIGMKLDERFRSKPGEEQVDDFDPFGGELPSGGARVVSRGGARDAPGDALPASLEKRVPVLMDSVEVAALSAAGEPRQAAPPSEAPGARAGLPGESGSPARGPDAAATGAGAPGPEPETGAAAPGETVSSSRPAAAPEKFVVIYVLALGREFDGRRLLELLSGHGMTLGEMDIFHRSGAAGGQEFSLASAVEPGVFDMATIDGFSTPGVTLFMRVHELAEPLRVFDDMLAVAKAIASGLNGEVRDGNRSLMTPEAALRCRQSIDEYRRGQPA